MLKNSLPTHIAKRKIIFITSIIASLAFILFSLTASSPSYGSDWYKAYNMEKVEAYSKTFNSNIVFYKSPTKWNTPSLTLIHGVGGSAEDFKKIVKQLSQHYQLFIPDLPGYGQSQSPKNNFSPSKYAQALYEVLPKLVRKRNIVIGHSMGGNISVQLSLKHPELAEKLILIDAAGFINKFSYSQYIANNYALDKIQLTEHEAPLLKGLINTVNKLIPDPSKVLLSDAGRKYLLENNSTYISAIAVLDENLTKLMRKPAPPTHIIWGGKDQVMPVQVTKLLSYLLKTQSIEIYETAGHSPQKQFPIQVANSIHNFIQNGAKSTENINKTTVYNQSITIDCDKGQTTDLLNNATYLNVTIKNCQPKSNIDNFTASQLVVNNSKLTFTNLSLNYPEGFSFIVLKSSINVWGGNLKGLSVGYIEESDIELHGADIYTKNTLVISNVPTTMNVSLTRVHQSNRSFSWHGMINVGF